MSNMNSNQYCVKECQVSNSNENFKFLQVSKESGMVSFFFNSFIYTLSQLQTISTLVWTIKYDCEHLSC